MFINELCTINDGNDVLTSFRNTYPIPILFKVGHQGKHASFLDFDIKIKDSVFLYKLFEKRDKFPFFIV